MQPASKSKAAHANYANPSVDPLMSLQVTWLHEFLNTLWAAEWFLIHMDPIMGLQSIWFGECLVLVLDILRYSHFEPTKWLVNGLVFFHGSFSLLFVVNTLPLWQQHKGLLKVVHLFPVFTYLFGWRLNLLLSESSPYNALWSWAVLNCSTLQAADGYFHKLQFFAHGQAILGCVESAVW